jgi:hypothetical protein
MIEINLLPKGKIKKKIEFPEIPFVPLLAGVLGFVVVLHLLFSLSLNIKTRTLRGLEKKWEEMTPDKEDADEIIRELTTMRSKMNAIDKLIEGRMSWAKKLSDLNDAIIPGVWLNRLWVEKRDDLRLQRGRADGEAQTAGPGILRTLRLNGSVIVTGGEETAAVGKFMWSLKNNAGFFADFTEVESAYMQRDKIKETEVMDFELVCFFKE